MYWRWPWYVTELCVQKSYSMPIGLDFQKRYATTVLELERLNKDLNKVLHQVQQFCCEVRGRRPPRPQHTSCLESLSGFLFCLSLFLVFVSLSCFFFPQFFRVTTPLLERLCVD